MNDIRTHPSSPDLWDRYASLPAGPRLVLGLKSLAFVSTGKTVFLECLTRAGLRGPDGKVWASRSVNAVLDALLAAGLLTEDLACQPALLHSVSVDAVASAQGALLVGAVRGAFPTRRNTPYYSYGQQFDCDALLRLIRLAIYTNDEAGFTANRDLHDKECAPHRAADLLALVFRDTTLAVDWLASRHPAIQLALLDAKLSVFLRSGVPGPDLPELLAHYRAQQDREGFAAVRRVLPQYDLLAGRLDEVRRWIARIEDATDVTRLALEGAVAFLEGLNAAAIQHYRDALKLRRKQVGKRKLFLEGVHGLLFLMALLRANDAGLQAEIQAGLDATLSNPSPHAGGFLAV